MRGTKQTEACTLSATRWSKMKWYVVVRFVWCLPIFYELNKCRCRSIDVGIWQIFFICLIEPTWQWHDGNWKKKIQSFPHRTLAGVWKPAWNPTFWVGWEAEEGWDLGLIMQWRQSKNVGQRNFRKLSFPILTDFFWKLFQVFPGTGLHL